MRSAPPRRVAAALWLSPPRSAAASQYVVVIEARVGARLARRRIQVIVLPASGNRPPTVESETRLAAQRSARFVVGAVDPDGDALTLKVESPEGASVTTTGPASWEVAVGGPLPVEVLLVATDAHGAKTIRRVEVVRGEPAVGITDVLERPTKPGR